jgi:hypothetical protein
MIVFADDTAFFSPKLSVAVIVLFLPHGIDTPQSYYNSWKIQINSVKLQGIFFTKQKEFSLSSSDRYYPSNC